jgi:hypothetical protein
MAPISEIVDDGQDAQSSIVDIGLQQMSNVIESRTRAAVTLG